MTKNKRIVGGLAIVLLCVGVFAYRALPTKIAFVNFQDSQMAEIAKANDNRFIEPSKIDVKTSDFSEITDYPVIYLFHISSLTEVQKNNISLAMKNGAKVHAFSATSKENDFSNISGEALAYIKKAYENGGESNTRKLLNYSRKILDNSSFFIDDVLEPDEFPHDVFYHIGTNSSFENLDDYWSFYKAKGNYNIGGKTVVIVNSSAGPKTQFRSYQDSIILNMEAKGYNVACIAGHRKRFENLKKINPDLFIYFPHGRINTMGGDEAVNWLKEKNILVLTPQLVHQTHEKWLADQQGMSGGLFGQNIVVPEIDGAIHPYAVAAQYINKQGYHTFKPIPGRIEKFCETADRWLSLKTKKNKDKKLCIYYYKGAGKNALVAGGLEVGESLFGLLNKLKSEGYSMGNLPDSLNGFMERIHKEGPVLGDYAKGTFETFLEEGNPALIPVKEYEKWVNSELDGNAYQNVIKQYGPAPGKYLTTTINDTDYLAIPRVQFGNIVLLPVLAAAMETNEFKLVHGVKQAPPHAYIASYLWSRMQFKTDVIAHFGAHGSVEFTPWKQVLLSSKDWAEALTAPVPHLYVYSIDNIGEAMMAKRRSYATMLSHLTPSYSEAELYGDFEGLGKAMHSYKGLANGPLKETFKKQIQMFADSIDIAKDLGLKAEDITTLNHETLDALHNYVHHLEREKITIGLHTLGVSYSDKELEETVRMMSVDPIAASLKQLKELTGRLNEKYDLDDDHAEVTHHDHDHDHDHKHEHEHSHKHDTHSENDFIAMANVIVRQIQKSEVDAISFMADEDLELLEKLEQEYSHHSKAKISEYYGGYYAQKTEKKVGRHTDKKDLVYDTKTHKMVSKSSLNKEPFTLQNAKDLAIHFSAQRKTAIGVKWINDDKSFKNMLSLTNKHSLHKFKMAANMDVSMKQKVSLASNEKYVELLLFLKDTLARGQIIKFLKETSTQDRISAYRSKLDIYTLKKVLEVECKNDFLWVFMTSPETLETVLQSKTKQELSKIKKNIKFVVENTELILTDKTNRGADLLDIKAILNNTSSIKKMNGNRAVLKSVISRVVSKEKLLLDCLKQLKNAFISVKEYRLNLEVSPKMEFNAFINGMNGGFIAPSSGGDPISNPMATPTGKNLYSVNAEVTPTKEAFETGAKLAELVLQKHISKHGDYPKKIAYSLWGGEFIRNQGLNIGQIFYMLGVEPVRNQRGRVHDVRLIPMDRLNRPRIDVVVQTSGQFRDLAASRINLINKAVQLAASADDDVKFPNYVKQGTIEAEQDMKTKGISPAEARKLSTVRVFGGVNGHYGTGIMDLVEQGDKWEKEEEIAKQYINNMGAMYADGNWANYKKGMFETMLKNTEVVIHPRSSNVTGPISLDHVYEFMGGITASVRVTTGKDPDGYFNDYRNKFDPKVQGLKEAIWTETRTNLFNPKFIKGQMAEGESAAEGFAENFRDTYGWNVMKPNAIDKEIWEGYYDIYIKDKLNLGTVEFFKDKNPFALQEMTAVMLETVRKGYWNPSEEVLKNIIDLHVELIKAHEAGCSGFVCDNAKLEEMISSTLSGEFKTSYEAAIAKVKTSSVGDETAEGIVLEKEEITLDKMKELIKENQSTVVTLILAIFLFGGAIGFGIYKRKRE